MESSKVALGIAAIIILAIAIYAFLFPAAAINQPSRDNSQAKLDMDTVCRSALVYMTFPSSVEAEAFVQDCKDGKHLEVVERWKQDNDITDDRAI